MLQRSLFTIMCCLCAGMSQAVLVVDGVGGAGKYATIEEASDAFRASASEEIIEIQTDGPIAGLDLRDRTLPRPLTIRAGAGFEPLITGAMLMIPSNQSNTTVTLEGLNVSVPSSDVPTGIPLFVGCNVEAEDCHFQNSATAPYGPAVACGYPLDDTNSELHLTSCSLQGHLALEVGRSVKDYFITSCTLIGSSDIPAFACSLAHFLNYPPTLGFIPYQDSAGYAPTDQARTMVIRDSLLQSTGKSVQWPPDNPWGDVNRYLPETHSVGPFTAINTVFVSLGNTGSYSNYGFDTLPATNEPRINLTHCTIRKNYQYGAFWAQTGTTVTINNCLFDDTFAGGYTVGYDSPGATLVGTNNAYNIPTGQNTTTGAAPFETGGIYFRRDNSSATDFACDMEGNILPQGEELVGGRAAILVPPVLLDKDQELRPQPSGALAGDIGADEIAETTSSVPDWQLF